MKGFEVTFFTQQGRRHGNHPIHQWLMEVGKSLGIKGVTTVVGAEGIGREGRLHSQHFFELADQPIEVTMALTEKQSTAIFEYLEQAHADLFYVRTRVEFGRVGSP